MTPDDDVAYWGAQVEAALDQLGVDAGVTERHNAGDVCVTPREIDDREERASLIRDLELRGFTVTSESDERYVYVDAPSDRLPAPFIVEVED